MSSSIFNTFSKSKKTLKTFIERRNKKCSKILVSQIGFNNCHTINGQNLLRENGKNLKKVLFTSKCLFHAKISNENNITGILEPHIKDNNSEINKTSLSSNKIKNLNNDSLLFNDQDIDSIMSEVTAFFDSKKNDSTLNLNKENNVNDSNYNSNISPYNSHRLNSKDNQNQGFDSGKEHLKKYVFSEQDIQLENDTNEIAEWEESLFSYKLDKMIDLKQEIKKLPFIKKLLFIYQILFISYIQKMDYRYTCQNIFDVEEFNKTSLDLLREQPLEIKIAYYISFKALKGSPPYFLNEEIKTEILKRFKNKKVSLNDILVFSKLNVIFQDISVTVTIFNFLSPIFERSISEQKFEEFIEKDYNYSRFFINLIFILLSSLRFLNFILNRFENIFMNMLTTVYNLRKYIFYSYDLNHLKALLNILIKNQKQSKLKNSEIVAKFQLVVNDLLIDYTDNYCSKILQSSQFSNLVNFFTKYYSYVEDLNEDIIKKILDINYLSLNILEKYSQNSLILLEKSIENFLFFFLNVREKIEENEELRSIMENILNIYFSAYRPNLQIADSETLDFSSIKNFDILYLIKLKYMYSTFFSRTDKEAVSVLVIISNFIDNSISTIKYYPVIYTIMGKCIKYSAIADKKKLFEFYVKNINIYLNDENFFLFIQNFDLLEKYGDINSVISDYRDFIIRQLIKMFYYNQIYYVFSSPNKLFYTLTAFVNNTCMIEYESNEENKKSKKKKSDAQDKTPKHYNDLENSYHPTLPKELYRFLNIIFYKIKNESSVFNIYARNLETTLNLVKLSYLNDPKLLKQYYFSVVYPLIENFETNYLDEYDLDTNINVLNFITYYISLIQDNEEIMIYQLKLLAKYVVIAHKITKTPDKLFFVLKKIEETYQLNPTPYDRVNTGKKYPKFLKLILRIKNKCYKNLRNVDNRTLKD